MQQAAETCFLKRMDLIAFDLESEVNHKLFRRGLETKYLKAGMLIIEE